MKFLQLLIIASQASIVPISFGQSDAEIAKLVGDSLLANQCYQTKWTVAKVSSPDPDRLKNAERDIQEKIDQLDQSAPDYEQKREELTKFLESLRGFYGGFKEDREVLLTYVNESKWKVVVRYSHLDKSLYISYSANGRGLVMVKDVGQRKILITDDVNKILSDALSGLPEYRLIRRFSGDGTPKAKIVDSESIQITFSNDIDQRDLTAILTRKDLKVSSLVESVSGNKEFSAQAISNGWRFNRTDIQSGKLIYTEDWRLTTLTPIDPSSIQSFSEKIEPGYLVDITTKDTNEKGIQSDSLRIQELE